MDNKKQRRSRSSSQESTQDGSDSSCEYTTTECGSGGESDSDDGVVPSVAGKGDPSTSKKVKNISERSIVKNEKSTPPGDNSQSKVNKNAASSVPPPGSSGTKTCNNQCNGEKTGSNNLR